MPTFPLLDGSVWLVLWNQQGCGFGRARLQVLNPPDKDADIDEVCQAVSACCVEMSESPLSS